MVNKPSVFELLRFDCICFIFVVINSFKRPMCLALFVIVTASGLGDGVRMGLYIHKKNKFSPIRFHYNS